MWLPSQYCVCWIGSHSYAVLTLTTKVRRFDVAVTHSCCYAATLMLGTYTLRQLDFWLARLYVPEFGT